MSLQILPWFTSSQNLNLLNIQGHFGLSTTRAQLSSAQLPLYIHWTSPELLADFKTQRAKMGSKIMILVLALFFCSAQILGDQNMDTQAATGPVDCGGLCRQRCSLHSRPNVCHRACGTCCVRCNCVPPGTYGNRQACGSCYTDMKTHGNRPKCP